MEVLIWLKDLFTCFESIRIVYDTHQFFFKSIVYFGLDIEKLICLHVLIRFCYGNDEVRREIFRDEKFIKFIEKLQNDTNRRESLFAPRYIERFRNCLNEFLLFKQKI